jgi:hypothetical protein
MKSIMLEQDWIYIICKPDKDEGPWRVALSMDKYAWTIIIWKDYKIYEDNPNGIWQTYIGIDGFYYNTKRLKLIWRIHNVNS